MSEMINKNAHLNPLVLKKSLEEKSTRDGYGEGLVLAGEADKSVVVLTADLGESTRCLAFKENFPDRFFEVGVAEQALVTVASGLANYGKIPFINSFAVFSPGRNWEQIRTTVAINNFPVKIAGHHAGLSIGEDGATHQALEDLALMRVLPNMTVIVPADYEEAKKATMAALDIKGPVYLRFTRLKAPTLTTPESPFEIGKARVLKLGKKVPLHGGGHAVRAFIHARDSSECVLKIMERGNPGDIFHISQTEYFEIREIVRMICEKLNVNFNENTETVENRFGQDSAYILDSSKARKELSWEPKIKLSDGLDDVIFWINKNWDNLKTLLLEYIHKE